MPFTLWSRGLFIGATDFALGEPSGPHLAGVFQPATSGMMLLPALTAMAPALFDLEAVMRRANLSADDADRDPERTLEMIEESPEGQRVIASAKEIEQLELRAPSGRVLEFDSILLSDVEDLANLGARSGVVKQSKRQRKPPGDPVRYLISVTLARRSTLMLA